MNRKGKNKFDLKKQLIRCEGKLFFILFNSKNYVGLNVYSRFNYNVIRYKSMYNTVSIRIFIVGVIFMAIILMGIVAVIIVIILIIAFWVIKTYNQFVTFGERVTNGKAQIGAQIESRWDAVKSLIDATKRYSKHEAETLEKVVGQRVGVSQDSSIEQMEEVDNQLNNVVGRLIAISESYPDLKASEVYKETMESIDKYENNVRQARMIYNDTVTRFNRLVRMFPSNFVAMIFKFTTKEYFQATESKQDMPSWD